MKRGAYIVFEGQDGAGKSTQAEKVVKRLQSEQIAVEYFREPGGAVNAPLALGEKLRELILDPAYPLDPLGELALFTANRVVLMTEMEKYLSKGVSVLCDRNFLSSVVYQGFGRGLSTEYIFEVTQKFQIKMPDLVILYAINEEVSAKRVQSRGGSDRFELENNFFQQKISDGYQALPKFCEQMKIPHITIHTDEQNWEQYEELAFRTILKVLND